MGVSVWQILIVAALVVLLFGRGRISDLMGDLGKGITSFRKGLKDGTEDANDDTPSSLEDKSGETADAVPHSEKSRTS